MRLPRNAQLWFPGLLKSRRARSRLPAPKTAWLIFADHYEPLWGRADAERGFARVAAWREAWPRIADRHRDSFGNPPRYTFFYPQEEYRPELVEPLAELTRQGIADVEVHIHHDGEGEQDFVERISTFVRALRDNHGLLHDVDGRPGFGFIHGNWALDNSHPSGRWCGLDNELTLLRELGCYADFTGPAAPDPCQTRAVNSIYWAVDDPARPRSHDDGIPVSAGASPPPGGLLMIQGPLALRWEGFRPKLEVGELAGNNPVTAARIDSWLDVAPQVGDQLFVKLHGHGAPEKNAGPLLGGDLDALLTGMSRACIERGMQLVHATAWEACAAIGRMAGGPEPA